MIGTILGTVPTGCRSSRLARCYSVSPTHAMKMPRPPVAGTRWRRDLRRSSGGEEPEADEDERERNDSPFPFRGNIPFINTRCQSPPGREGSTLQAGRRFLRNAGLTRPSEIDPHFRRDKMRGETDPERGAQNFLNRIDGEKKVHPYYGPYRDDGQPDCEATDHPLAMLPEAPVPDMREGDAQATHEQG